jgi:hypothetical protein
VEAATGVVVADADLAPWERAILIALLRRPQDIADEVLAGLNNLPAGAWAGLRLHAGVAAVMQIGGGPNPLQLEYVISADGNTLQVMLRDCCWNTLHRQVFRWRGAPP